jgi:importin subunit alpha-6/7
MGLTRHRRNVVWAISNICRGKPSPPLDLLLPLLPYISECLSSPGDTEVMVDACWALSYISDGENERIDAVLQAGVVHRLIECLSSSSPTLVTPALRTLGNLLTGTNEQTQVVMNAGVLSGLKQVLGHQKRSVVKESCWALSNIAAGTPDQIQALFDQNVFDEIFRVSLSVEIAPEVKKEALWCMANVTECGTFEQMELLIRAGALVVFVSSIEQSDHPVRRVALEGLSNLIKAGEAKGLSTGEVNPVLDQLRSSGLLDTLLASEDLPEAISARIVSFISPVSGSGVSGDE